MLNSLLTICSPTLTPGFYNLILKNHALTIAYDNSDVNSKIVKEAIESHPYNYFLASKVLSEYKIGLGSITDIGLYFGDTDYILTSSYKYSFREFLTVYSGATSKQAKNLIDFFNTDTNDITMMSTFDCRDYTDARLFIGIPVKMNSKHKSLIFYMMKYNSISTSFFGTQSSEQLRFCIFDYDGNLVFTNRKLDPLLLKDKNFASFITDIDSSIFEYNNDTDRYTIFKARNAHLGKIFISIVPQDQIEASFWEFYMRMKNNTILIAIGFVLMLIIIVYINYKPILKLVHNIINKHGNTGINSELKTITHAFKKMEEYVSEQRVMLMDYLLGNLLYGISIPKADAERLDVNLLNGNFCVIGIAELKLDSAERVQFAEYIHVKCNIHTNITDILYKNHMVLICVLKDEKEETITNLATEVKQYLCSKNRVSYKIGVGHIVYQLDDIHKSYMNALYSMELSALSVSASGAEISLIENYPSDSITLFLQYVQNAQLDNALKTLEEIIQYIIKKTDTAHLQRYICYDILTSYFKCLKRINYPITIKEASDLLAHNNARKLYNALTASVKLVCESIANINDNIYNSLQKEILNYVNENFTDPNICRTQVADHFGISIYSLSRLFKDSIGIGFSEYVTAKRMELSRQLLLTSNESIAQIASQIGINDPNYFSKLFKTTYNMSPSKYRGQK